MQKDMSIRFEPATDYPAGTALCLLKQAWSPLWSPDLEENIARFDAEVLGCPGTIGACTFITTMDGLPVGMASYDLRQKPDRSEIGWNCVIPQYQRKGIGRAQIEEILRVFRKHHVRTACVTTTNEGFFAPAQRTYEACGFVVARRTENNNLEYELILENCTATESTIPS